MYEMQAEIIREEFKRRYDHKRYGTYGAIDYAIKELKNIVETENLYQHSILINRKNNTAIYTGLCNRSSNTAVKNSRKKDKSDKSKRGVRVRTAEKAVRGFFNNVNYVDYTLAFSLSTKRHEACVFIRKIGENYKILHYNPTFTQNITILRELLQALNIVTITYGYHEKANNLTGYCSYFAWSEMINMVLLNKNPFKRVHYWFYSKTHRKFVLKSKGKIKL